MKYTYKMMLRNQKILILLVHATLITLNNGCSNVEIVSLTEWGGKTPLPLTDLKLPQKHIIISHTVTPQCHSKTQCANRMRSMQEYHMHQLGWPNIGYNFVIGGDGRVYEGTGWTKEGIHTYGWNPKSYGISFIGDYRFQKPNNAMIKAAHSLTICGIKKGYISKSRELHGARDATCTESPGNALYEIIKKWPRFKGGPLPGYKC
ncbi:peptidoglycan-recognition protein 1 isoform X2 [Parasteatoda tepidariorum]|uniref:peptidoglycan-recognition protein 1 isoform X2 n=1 Tax=Parasteatoda tepidariorum TaxID=114398 RepID=UPI00077FA067|nr:peptidoglycan-recognition protein 1 isoform X2 [Parasteatoda tepidariorum]